MTNRAASTLLTLAVLAFAASGVAVADSDRTAGGHKSKSVEALPATFSGKLVVEFHGDAATGCAERGLCGYDGTVEWTPAPSWQLQTSDFVYRRYAFSLQTQSQLGDSPFAGGVTDEDTTQELSGVSPPGSNCGDAALTGGQIDFPLEQHEVIFSLASAYTSLVQTRCAGPLATDLASALPEAIAPLRAVLRGNTTIDLNGDRSFSANGFGGTVESTLMLRLGKPESGGIVTPPGPSPRYRVVTARYDVAVAGAAIDHIRAENAPAACEPLGACGLEGTVSLQPGIGGAGATIAAEGPERLPYPDFVAALHLGRTRHIPDSMSVGGSVSWHNGVASARVSRDGFNCTDSVQLGAGEIYLDPSKSGLRANYYVEDSPSGDVFRTRCPGPFGAEGQPVSAVGRVPWSRAEKRRFVLQLNGRQSAHDDGYTQQIGAHLTLTFTRVSVSSN